MKNRTPFLLTSTTLLTGLVFPFKGVFATGDVDLLFDSEIIQACKSTLETDPFTFRQQLRTHIYRVLVNDINRSIPNLVTTYWYRYRIDEIYDRVVREIVQKEKENSSLWTRIKGSFSPGTAKELGEKIAKKAFNDPRVQSALSDLIQSVTRDVMDRVKERLTSVQDFMGICIREAAGDNINPALLKLFAQTLERGSKKGVQNLQLANVGGVYVPYKSGAGLALIAIRRQILSTIEKRLAQRMTARIVGQVAKRVASKFIPVIGIVLTAWDIVDIASGNSLFNSLQEALTSQEVKDRFRLEVIKALKEEMTQEANSIANDVTKSIYLAVKATVEKLTKYNEALNEDPLLTQAFENLLQQGKVDEAQKLLDLALYAKRIGIYDRFENLLTQPQKLEAILQLYPSFLPILNYTKSFEDVYLWYQLVDEDPKKFQKIVDLELYKYLDPQKVDKQVVNYLLKFGDFGTVKLIAENVPADVLKELTSIEPYKLEKFAETYGVKGLICLTDYVKIKPTIAQEIVTISEKDPKVVYFLCRPEVKEYLSKYPAEFEDIVSAYEDQKGLIGKIKLLLLGSIGSYSEDVIKLTNPKLYKLVWVIRLILVFILLGVIWKIYSFVRGLFSFRRRTSTTEVHYIREETKPVHVEKTHRRDFYTDGNLPSGGQTGKRPYNGKDRKEDNPNG